MAATTNKKTPASKRSTTRTSRAAVSKRQVKVSSVSLASIFATLRGNVLGRAVLFLLVAALLIGFDFLISFNVMDRFFIALGIECILLVLIGWIRFVLRGKAGEDN